MAEIAAQTGTPEQTFVNNAYGTVTNKRVVYYRAKGWFSGGSREDIPLQHVTSVRLDTARSWLPGILLFLMGLGLMGGGDGGAKVIGLVLLALGLLLMWGSPSVVVNTAGRDLNASKGAPWTRGDANAFVEALRSQLFSK